MNYRIIVTIVRKEWAELYKNTLVLSSVFFMPLIFAVLPLAILWGTGGYEGTVEAAATQLPAQMTAICQGLSAGACGQVFIASQFMILFIMVPLIVPATIGPYSIVGEKTQRTLEPILAAPISTTDLLMAKNLGSTIPAVLATWVAFGVFAVGARLLIHDDATFARLLETRWLVAVLVLGPLLAVFSVNLATMVSARSNDPRTAQQIASLVVFPAIFLFIGQLTGFLFLSSIFVIFLSLGVLVIDILLTALAVRVFDREAILTRWT